MIKAFTALVFMVFCLLGRGQLYDAQWVLGFNESVVDFRTADTVFIDTLPTLQYFFLTNACICDENGDLLYYTNGVNVCGVTDILFNGTGLSNGAYSSTDSLDGLPIQQGAIFIPVPGSTCCYYLFHTTNDAFGGTRPGTIYYSMVDKYGNGGLGSVALKNHIILKNVVLREGGITACKHANGRDYWLVFEGSVNNKFYKFLVTPDSIVGPFVQYIGPDYPLPYDWAYSKFSQDGSKYVTGTAEGLILVVDFDRCSGVFSNPVTIFNNGSTNPDTSISSITSVEFSPNNRFVYAADNFNLVQYDLEATNIQDSVLIFSEFGLPGYGINMLQTGPNGKIYGSTYDGGLRELHVINKPDLKGDSCHFVYGGQHTYTINSANLPNLINYKLGPLLGSGCDTLNTGEKPVTLSNSLRILPNPANKYAYVEMGAQGNYQFNLLNEAGQLMAQKQTRQVDIFDTESLSPGVYFIRVTDKGTGAELAVKKVAVVH